MSFDQEHLDEHHECRREIHDLAAEVERLRHAILDFLRWENEEPHNEAQWLEALELLAEAAEAEGGDE